ncbi:5-dehydro-4-deoxyglucarate dehydratase [Martelella endophytica]|uniref:Probable 5-dehydro-4-deoxyglucarate dehydratase n=1 Tax=Martelella endophytica TaxID=1486262 RepID=A0A0D5LL23_MAREN|nr:5-dehydro-4-deoxyglucarate dehydratase [Martelella endophytica]AJY44879.1 5-dehydro-4-deoxyglucarate dehydratase [Martelella endophytica]
MTPDDLKSALGSGLLSFPVTTFKPDLSIDEEAYRSHIDWLDGYGAAVLFAPGGTGELFSLTPDETARVTRIAKASAGRTPIVGGAAYGTAMAVEMARNAEAAGADGILLLPPYLMFAEQEGLIAHVKAVCDAVGIGVVVYNRDNIVLTAESLLRLTDTCSNLIGFKDGYGEVDRVIEITTQLQDRLVYIGGMPTHELYAQAYYSAGVTTYSSAVFNFVPQLAQDFYSALRKGDKETTDRLLKEFFFPLVAMRNRKKGYAVSIIKAGLEAIGRRAGPVRPPLTDLSASEMDELKALIDQIV